MIIDTNALEMALTTHKAYHRSKHRTRYTDQLIEESAELTQALMKERRGIGSRAATLDEIADLCICLEFLGRELKISRDELLTYCGKKLSKLDYELETLRFKRDGGKRKRGKK